jgi:hypothetical protein
MALVALTSKRPSEENTKLLVGLEKVDKHLPVSVFQAAYQLNAPAAASRPSWENVTQLTGPKTIVFI